MDQQQRATSAWQPYGAATAAGQSKEPHDECDECEPRCGLAYYAIWGDGPHALGGVDLSQVQLEPLVKKSERDRRRQCRQNHREGKCAKPAVLAALARARPAALVA